MGEPLSYLGDISSQYRLKGGAMGRSMLEKGVKRHLSSRGRKQYRQPSDAPIPQDQVSSLKVSDQKGRMEIYLPQANEMCIVLTQT